MFNFNKLNGTPRDTHDSENTFEELLESIVEVSTKDVSHDVTHSSNDLCLSIAGECVSPSYLGSKHNIFVSGLTDSERKSFIQGLIKDSSVFEFNYENRYALDGYAGEDVLLFKDFDPTNHGVTFNKMNSYLADDMYVFKKCEYKISNTPVTGNLWKTVIVSCDRSLDLLWNTRRWNSDGDKWGELVSKFDSVFELRSTNGDTRVLDVSDYYKQIVLDKAWKKGVC